MEFIIIILVFLTVLIVIAVVYNKFHNLLKTIELENERKKKTNEVELYADSLLITLINLTPYEDLKKYLSELRTRMVVEFKRVKTIPFEAWNENLLITQWKIVRQKISAFAITLPDFVNYEVITRGLRDNDVILFAKQVFEAKEYGNGSFEDIFNSLVKKYIKEMLEFTFNDFQEFKRNGFIEKVKDFKLKPKELMLKALEENELNYVFSELRKYITDKDMEDYRTFIMTMANYNGMRQNQTLTTEHRQIIKAQINENLLYLIGTLNF